MKDKLFFQKIGMDNFKFKKDEFLPVLWIRIWPDPKTFARSNPGPDPE